MTILLQIKDAFKRYGEQHLLDGASATISDEHKIGLIGRNGAGKSTLCRIILGSEELDAGEISLHPRLRLGYLRQHDPFEPDETVLDFLMRDSGKPDWRCGEVAWRFDLKGPVLNRPVSELSGGWQTRVKLAGLLLHDPNLLLLDEPTNFLDLRTQMMLENFLREYRGGCLIVSHDRAFLKATCSHTLELARGKLTLFPGDVDTYLENQRERNVHDERVNATVMAKQRQLQTFIDKNRGSPRTSSQARSKAKQLERLQLKEIELAESNVSIRIPDVDVRKGTAVRCVDLAIGYPDLEVARNINVDLEHGSRIAVVGDNGQGKTTFLRSLTESLSALDGEVSWGYGCDLGVYAQHVYTTLPEKWTVQEYLQDAAASDTRTQAILNVAGSFLFRGDDVDKKIAVLSGGERARLCLAGLLLGRHNILALDEPGNHLDVETVDALAEALIQYKGTLIFTSHDRHFMGRVATGVVEVRDGRVSNYPGDYSTYVYRVGKEVDDNTRKPSPTPGGDNPPTGKPGKGNDRDDRRERNRKRREIKKEVITLERKIARFDEQKKELHKQLLTTSDPVEASRLHNETIVIAKQLEEIEHRWFALQEQVEEAE